MTVKSYPTLPAKRNRDASLRRQRSAIQSLEDRRQVGQVAAAARQQPVDRRVVEGHAAMPRAQAQHLAATVVVQRRQRDAMALRQPRHQVRQHESHGRGRRIGGVEQRDAIGARVVVQARTARLRPRVRRRWLRAHPARRGRGRPRVPAHRARARAVRPAAGRRRGGRTHPHPRRSRAGDGSCRCRARLRRRRFRANRRAPARAAAPAPRRRGDEGVEALVGRHAQFQRELRVAAWCVVAGAHAGGGSCGGGAASATIPAGAAVSGGDGCSPW